MGAVECHGRAGRQAHAARLTATSEYCDEEPWGRPTGVSGVDDEDAERLAECSRRSAGYGPEDLPGRPTPATASRSGGGVPRPDRPPAGPGI